MNKDAGAGLAKLAAASAKKAAAGLYVSFPCRVISFDEATCMATVQPLLRITEEDPAPIQNVPALGHKYRTEGGTVQVYRPVLQPGDMVLVVCADREIKNTLSGVTASPDTDRKHSKNDAVIVGVFSCSL
ncbi:Gp138 family membrane-puncturing spike protein [Paenibacillus caseinilyticus]|uniref:Gp138 family membrane-puncturing spike protein n=1 Tax=Paenibacillus caseinilyticus TaxID=3098138 RepID=UPI0022B8CFC4|nr:Gp138 family membrane-puncturing spike protein [Paenibacillus caseinilyticus]MCZ8518891.1 Gp138 family membrane-puncturing spike protein [Paenibacillus caseinilyticus]